MRNFNALAHQTHCLHKPASIWRGFENLNLKARSFKTKASRLKFRAARVQILTVNANRQSSSDLNLALGPSQRYYFDLHKRAFGEFGDLHRAASGLVLAERRRVYLVHRGKIAHIG